jgi:hypothetical protein
MKGDKEIQPCPVCKQLPFIHPETDHIVARVSCIQSICMLYGKDFTLEEWDRRPEDSSDSKDGVLEALIMAAKFPNGPEDKIIASFGLTWEDLKDISQNTMQESSGERVSYPIVIKLAKCCLQLGLVCEEMGEQVVFYKYLSQTTSKIKDMLADMTVKDLVEEASNICACYPKDSKTLGKTPEGRTVNALRLRLRTYELFKAHGGLRP